MRNYVIRRLLFALPTVVLALMIAFGLSKCHNSDPAEELCLLQGVNTDSRTAEAEYKKHYQNLGLDLPTFYFSIIPHFWHPNPNSMIDRSDRRLVRSLQNEGVSYQQILSYIIKRDELLKLVNSKDTLKSQSYRSLVFSENLQDIKSIVSKETSFHSLTRLISHMEDSSQRKIYFPRIIFHGFQNQFHRWFSGLLVGNMGISIRDGQNVELKVWNALRWTLILVFFNLVISSIISITAGMLSGFYQGKWPDKISQILWLILYSIPTFWMASMLILFMTSDRYGMNIFPVPGNIYGSYGQSFVSQVIGSWQQLVLPIICLVANDIAFFSRIARNQIVEHSLKLYVTIAKSRGIGDIKILWSYIMPNIFISLITMVIGMVPAGISGALLIEIIFNIPGIGRLLYESIQSSDWSVVYAIISIVASVTIITMILGDILYAWANPKIDFNQRYDEV